MNKKNIGRVPNKAPTDDFLVELNNANKTSNSDSTGRGYFGISGDNRNNIYRVQQELFKLRSCIDSQ